MSPEGWRDLSAVWPSRPVAWQERCAYSLHSFAEAEGILFQMLAEAEEPVARCALEMLRVRPRLRGPVPPQAEVRLQRLQDQSGGVEAGILQTFQERLRSLPERD